MKKLRLAMTLLALLGAATAAHAQARLDPRATHDRDRDRAKAELKDDGVKPEQASAERSHETRTEARIRELVHSGRHVVTQEERKAVDDHWRRATRIWRIRHLAENAGDEATVARCDTLLARADKILETQLKKLADKAPVQVGGSR